MPGLRLCEIVCAGVAPRALLASHCPATSQRSARNARRFVRSAPRARALFCAHRAHRPPFSHSENRTANPVFALPPRSARAHIALPPRSAIAEPAQCEPTGAHWAGTPSHCARAVRNFPAQCDRVGMVCYVGLVCGTFLCFLDGVVVSSGGTTGFPWTARRKRQDATHASLGASNWRARCP